MGKMIQMLAGVDMGGLWWERIYVSADFFCITLVLAFLLSKSICDPLEQIHGAVDAVAKEDLSVRVAVQSNDELGDVAEGINTMVDRLAENQRTRGPFGRYLSREIRDEILAGRVAMDGEMKRVTLLFADLCRFTGLVEEHHPRRNFPRIGPPSGEFCRIPLPKPLQSRLNPYNTFTADSVAGMV